MLLSGSSHHISDNSAFIFSSLTLTQEYKFNIFKYLLNILSSIWSHCTTSHLFLDNIFLTILFQFCSLSCKLGRKLFLFFFKFLQLCQISVYGQVERFRIREDESWRKQESTGVFSVTV